MDGIGASAGAAFGKRLPLGKNMNHSIAPETFAEVLAHHKSIEALNSECFCITLDEDALRNALESKIGRPGLFELIAERCPYLFSARPVFISRAHAERMQRVIQAIESVVAMPGYQQEVLGRSPALAQTSGDGSLGVLFGYDFHVAAEGFGLIEINTNAGGLMLNAALARAQRACCLEMQGMVPSADSTDSLGENVVSMFRHEWRLAGHEQPLRRIAIVDDDPQGQYLYPEFLLFQELFLRHGIDAVIADPLALRLEHGALWHDAHEIDLVYNRLTDFSFESDSNAVLRAAYLGRAAVITPNPRLHALYADKRNLVLLTDPSELNRLGVATEIQNLLLTSIPRTEIVGPINADRLWNDRRHLFFKPYAGFGSRAAYRGDKLTKRVWESICDGGFVAQALVSPGQRIISDEKPGESLKFDLRNYTYNGSVQWVSARLYQGQTTNFRTPDGGFAPVFIG